MSRPTEPVGNCQCGGAVREWEKNFSVPDVKQRFGKSFWVRKLRRLRQSTCSMAKQLHWSLGRNRGGGVASYSDDGLCFLEIFMKLEIFSHISRYTAFFSQFQLSIVVSFIKTF